MNIDAELLAKIVRRIVEVANPEKIILFGSAAKGGMGPNSDLDLLVIASGPIHRGRLTLEILGLALNPFKRTLEPMRMILA